MTPTPLYYIGTSTDPYANLALEQTLAAAVQPGECLLYLWQNEHTIVIGRNQNAWKECRIADFEATGGRLARRLSGGGAVYHDTGNLNFTFAARQEDYDVARQVQVICEAVRAFGLEAEVSGRNDVVIDGAKFSGNAYFRSGDKRCHHGTLMIKVDMGALSHYLVPDERKLKAKGIDSVRSRVVNLADLDARVEVKTLSDALVEALSAVYGSPARPLPRERVDEEALRLATERFGSWDWRFGSSLPFTHAFDERYGWGGLDIELFVEDGFVRRARISSDALDADFIATLEEALVDCRYELPAIKKRLEELDADSPLRQEMAAGCLACIEQGF